MSLELLSSGETVQTLPRIVNPDELPQDVKYIARLGQELLPGLQTEVEAEAAEIAKARRMREPRTYALLRVQESKVLEAGMLPGFYPVTEDNYDLIATDAPDFCGPKTPELYVADSAKVEVVTPYLAPQVLRAAANRR